MSEKKQEFWIHGDQGLEFAAYLHLLNMVELFAVSSCRWYSQKESKKLGASHVCVYICGVITESKKL